MVPSGPESWLLPSENGGRNGHWQSTWTGCDRNHEIESLDHVRATEMAENRTQIDIYLMTGHHTIRYGRIQYVAQVASKPD